MNVYDFDRTIFSKDSSEEFYRYCLRRFPRLVITPLLPKLRESLSYVFGGKEADASPMKEQFFSFLGSLQDPQTMILDFWKENFSLIQPWYLAQTRPEDLVISASPDFLVRPATEALGVSLIATPMDPFSGHIMGRNCHDVEKVRRFREEYPDFVIDAFYSDSLSDTPLASIATKAYLVKGNVHIPWPLERKNKNETPSISFDLFRPVRNRHSTQYFC